MCGYVDDTITASVLVDVDYKSKILEWNIVNVKVITWLSNAVDFSIGTQFAPFDTVEAIWDHLASLYVQSNVANGYGYLLENEIRATRQGDKNMQEYYNIMCNFWDHLALMEPKELTSMEVYLKFWEKQHLVQLLLGLRVI